LNKAVALFSGGKDSTLSILRAIRDGYKVTHLMFIVPTFPYPNPHMENYHIVEKIALAMGIPIRRIALENGKEQESLAEAIRKIHGVEALIAGDVLLEEHLKWHKKVSELSGVELVEPLFGEDTAKLYEELIMDDIEFTIIATIPLLPKSLIGTRIHQGNWDYIRRILKAYNSDPIGEYGEYHTLVNKSPLLKTSPLEYRPRQIVERDKYGSYGIFQITT